MGLKHQAAAARKWRSAARQVARHFPAHLPPLLFLTDPGRTPEPLSVIETLPQGAGVIYRHFGAPDRRAVARDMAQMCARRHLVFLIAADPLLAIETGADGVHWPERLLFRSRYWRGRFFLETTSAHSRVALHHAAKAGVDAALFSTVYPSQSSSAGLPLGAIRFRQISKLAQLPIYSLGGVTAHNMSKVADCSGAASVSGFKN